MSNNNYINVMFIGGSTIVGGLLNYIYHPIMLNFLSIEDFGVFSSLVGILNILGVIFVGLILFLNKEVSKNINNLKKVKHIFFSSTKLLAIIGIFTYILFLILAPYISSFLNININYVYIVGLGIIIGFLMTSTTGTLRGLKKFQFLSMQQILTPFLKLLFGVTLVYLGTNVYGAIWGFILSSFLVFLISFYYLYKNLKIHKYKNTTKELLVDLLDNKKEITNFFYVSLFFSIFMNIDIILAKNIFDSEIAGIYAGLSVIGKFLIFLLLSIETVYYGQIMEYKLSDTPFHLIRNSLFLIAFVCIITLIINYYIGAEILSFLKSELANYTFLYMLILVYYSLLAFISFFIKVLIGWKKYYINKILLLLTTILIVFIYTFGSINLWNFISIFIFVGFIGIIVLSILFYVEYKRL